jgi:hypothetical protein
MWERSWFPNLTKILRKNTKKVRELKKKVQPAQLVLREEVNLKKLFFFLNMYSEFSILLISWEA